MGLKLNLIACYWQKDELKKKLPEVINRKENTYFFLSNSDNGERIHETHSLQSLAKDTCDGYIKLFSTYLFHIFIAMI